MPYLIPDFLTQQFTDSRGATKYESMILKKKSYNSDICQYC